MQAGFLSTAARRLGKTQSTFSAAIANLEADVDVELFDRSSRTPSQTEGGRKLLLDAESVLESCFALGSHANSLIDTLEG
jgi:DNA-binding transcriptional LysR family regulator